MVTTTVLSARDLNCGYGDLTVLRSLSFDLPQGAFGVIGAPNGAGKTTLMNCLAGVLDRSGSVTGSKGALRARSPRSVLRAGVALVPENRELFPELTVAENLELGSYALQARRASRRQYAEVVARQRSFCLDLFPVLRDRSAQAAGTLSGGEQQMLAVARALMANPTVLLLDEPTLGLAPIIVESMRAALVELNRSGTSVLLAEQNSRAFTTVATHLWRLHDGHLEALSTEGEYSSDLEVVR